MQVFCSPWKRRGSGRRQVSYTVFYLIAGSLVPAQTSVFVWLDKFMLCSTLKNTHYEVSKKFMYEEVTRSSKMSFGLGLSLLSNSASAETAEAKGPEKGKPVYEYGKPKINSTGKQISFNAEIVKEWSRLTIKADVERLLEIGGYDVHRIEF